MEEALETLSGIGAVVTIPWVRQRFSAAAL